jgi:hypothetical protein
VVQPAAAQEVIFVCGSQAFVKERVDEGSLSNHLKQSLTLIEATKVDVPFKKSQGIPQNFTQGASEGHTSQIPFEESQGQNFAQEASEVQMIHAFLEETHCLLQSLTKEASEGHMSHVSFEESQDLPLSIDQEASEVQVSHAFIEKNHCLHQNYAKEPNEENNCLQQSFPLEATEWQMIHPSIQESQCTSMDDASKIHSNQSDLNEDCDEVREIQSFISHQTSSVPTPFFYPSHPIQNHMDTEQEQQQTSPSYSNQIHNQMDFEQQHSNKSQIQIQMDSEQQHSNKNQIQIQMDFEQQHSNKHWIQNQMDSEQQQSNKNWIDNQMDSEQQRTPSYSNQILNLIDYQQQQQPQQQQQQQQQQQTSSNRNPIQNSFLRELNTPQLDEELSSISG